MGGMDILILTYRRRRGNEPPAAQPFFLSLSRRASSGERYIGTATKIIQLTAIDFYF
jgi:hypothetical protein